MEIILNPYSEKDIPTSKQKNKIAFVFRDLILSTLLFAVFLFAKREMEILLDGRELPFLTAVIFISALLFNTYIVTYIMLLSIVCEFIFFIVPEHGLFTTYVSGFSLLLYAATVMSITYVLNKQKKYEQSLAKLYEQQSQWVAKVSHEIRTPLNGILGLTEILNGENLNSAQHNLVTSIENATKSLKYIVDGILDFSKNQHPGKSFTTVFLMNDLLINLRDMFLPLAQKKKLNLKLTNLEKQIYVQTEREKVFQILSNLIENSIKYTEKGFVEILAKSIQVSETDIKISFEINDTGVGIAKDDLALIFEPFYRSPRNDFESEGLGLGLANAKQLATSLGGSIAVVSKLNIGTKFIVEILAKVASSEKRIEESTQITAEKNHLKIIFAEDNSLNQFVVKGYLEKMGHAVHIVKNGLEICEDFHKEKYDLVIMDCHMPELDGISAIKNIRKHSAVPIIALTADTTNITKQNALQAGANLILYKPVLQKELLAAVNALTHVHSVQKTLNFLDTNTIHQMHKIFLNETPKKLDLLTTHMKKSDYTQVKNIAHNLKSSFIALGGSEGAALCENIESMALQKNLLNSSNSINQLNNEFLRIKEELLRNL